MFRALLVLFLFVSINLVGEELYYTADRPVAFTSTFFVDIRQKFPSFSINGKMEQKVRLEVSVLSEQSNTPLFALPYDLSFVLKGMHIDLTFNGDKTSQNLKNPGTSLFLAQLAEIVDKPIKLRLGKDRLFHDEEGMLKNVSKGNQFLSSSMVNNFFNDILELPFALAGEDLAIGKVFRRRQIKELGDQDIHLEIVAMDSATIMAKVRGNLPPHKVDDAGMEMMFKGHCEGMVTWKRANPLMCMTDMRYYYEGEMQIDGAYGTLEYNMQHKVVADGMGAS